jgi:glycosyltransferase involved in cell wall biosynthesis
VGTPLIRFGEVRVRILQVHNHYLQAGGEDVVVAGDAALLRARGHEVHAFTTSSGELDLATPIGKARTAVRTVWSRDGRARLRDEIRRVRPDLVHVHNTFPVLSPAALRAGHDEGVPVVQTLHNYRVACAAATLLRDGRPCQDCVGGSKLPAVRHTCYHDSRAQSLAVAAMQTVHRWAGTYRSAVDAFIALTPFMRDVMVREGLPEDGIHVAPNVLQDVPAAPPADPDAPGRDAPGHDAPAPDEPAPRRIAFVGRLSSEKGADLLLRAWARLDLDGWTLDVVGDGPQAPALRDLAAGRDDVRFHGWRPREEVHGIVAGARALVLPSRWYEGFPITLLEALALGRPVAASDHGAFVDTVVEGRTGWRFAPDDEGALASTLDTVARMDDDAWHAATVRARAAFDADYTADAGYQRLMAVYDAAIARWGRASGGI